MIENAFDKPSRFESRKKFGSINLNLFESGGVSGEMQAIDFFCGCGGSSAGLRKAGIEVLAGIDNDPDAGCTFRMNFPEAKFFQEDIRNLHTFCLEPLIKRERNRPLLFSACAPCQPFTKQKTTRRSDDNRMVLLDEFHRFVRVFRPDYIFLENVPGFKNDAADRGPLARFLKFLDELGYKFDMQSPESRAYGVPQVRKRLVLVASLLGKISVPPATHGPGTGNPNFASVWDTIGNLPEIRAGEEHDAVKNHRAASLSGKNLERIAATPEGGGRLDWPEELRLACHREHSGHTDVYGRLRKARPAAALSTRCISFSNGRYGHPTQDRAISVREAARLQSFDDSFEFAGSLNSMARQIGNAVPVRLAEVFASHFNSHYKGSPYYGGSN